MARVLDQQDRLPAVLITCSILDRPFTDLLLSVSSIICALLGRFAISARVALLWQHNTNAKC